MQKAAGHVIKMQGAAVHVKINAKSSRPCVEKYRKNNQCEKFEGSITPCLPFRKKYPRKYFETFAY